MAKPDLMTGKSKGDEQLDFRQPGPAHTVGEINIF